MIKIKEVIKLYAVWFVMIPEPAINDEIHPARSLHIKYTHIDIASFAHTIL